MRYSVVCGLASGLMSVAAAIDLATVSDVMFDQPGAGRPATITYSIDKPAIVTLDVYTNGVHIGYECLADVTGDVNGLVPAGSGRILWTPTGGAASVRFNRKALGTKAVVVAWPTDAPPDYLVVSLDGTKARAYYPAAECVPGGVTNDVYKTEKLVLRKIRAAGIRWVMGSPVGEKGRDYNQWNPPREVPHYVTLTNDYYMGVFEVTQSQLELACKKRYGAGPKYPAAGISYYALRGWGNQWWNLWPSMGHTIGQNCLVKNLRDLSGIASLDLPTDAQWEFACRAGAGTSLYGFQESNANSTDVSANLDKIAWYDKNSGSAAHEVGLKDQNAFGLYDMLGNVAELCLDGYQDATSAETVDPVGYASATYNSNRTLRGGKYSESWKGVRCAARLPQAYDTYADSIGFRVVCELNQ